MTSPVVCCFAVHVPPVLLESDTVARWLGLSRLSDCLDLIHVGAHLGPCPLTGVHRAARRGLRPLRYQRRHLQKTFGFSELGGIFRT
jgi:hypothetical protein